MKLTLSAAAFLLLGLSALSQVNEVVVQGEVVDRDTGLPLAGARVVFEKNPPVTRNGSPEDHANYDLMRLATAPVVFTDTAGMFRFRTSTLDGYTVHVDAKGYVSGSDGCIWLCKFKTGELVNSKIRLVRSGVVTGTIREVSGAPIRNLPVRLVRRHYEPGHDTLEAAYGVFTDDRGQYRLYDVEPGRYYLLSGSGLPVYLDNAAGLPLGDPSRLPDVYGHLYYPGVLSSDDASIILVKPGGENTGVDFTVSRPVTHRIQARVIDSRTGQAPAEARIAIIEQNTMLEGPERAAVENFVRSGARRAYDAASGRLDFPNLAPGTCFISATVVDRRLPGMPRDARPAELFGSAAVEVTNADVENVVVTVFPHGAITGRIRLTGRTGGTNINHFALNLVPSKPGGDSFDSSYAETDGTFQIEGVTPGDSSTLLQS